MEHCKDEVMIAAHKKAFNNMKALEQKQQCGCFYCLANFSSEEIEEWIDDEPYGTACCPRCGIDSVLGESSGFPITKDFLQKMERYWFASHLGVNLATPMGDISLLLDGKPVACEKRCIDSDGLFRTAAKYIVTIELPTDNALHIVCIQAVGDNAEYKIKKEEKRAEILFAKDNRKLTICCERLCDCRSTVCSKGIQIKLLPARAAYLQVEMSWGYDVKNNALKL